MLKTVPLTSLKIHPALQHRTEQDREHIQAMTESLAECPDFQLPPVKVVERPDGALIVWDGHHTCAAYKAAGRVNLTVDAQAGDYRKAWELSLSANSIHGLRRKSADLAKIMEAVLGDDALINLSDREIAKKVGASHATISRLRQNLSVSRETDAPRKVTRAASRYSMNTDNIGARQRCPEAEMDEDSPTPAWTANKRVRQAIDVLSRALDERGVFENWKARFQELQADLEASCKPRT